MIASIVACRTEQNIPYAVACRALDVSESWFYKHKDRPPTATQTQPERLDVAVNAAFGANSGEYGSPRLAQESREQPGGEFALVSVNTVAVSMHRQGLKAKKQPIRRSLTRPDPHAPKFPNILNRNFNAAHQDEKWVGDITEIQTWEGKLFLATVIDLYSRRLIGFAIATHCKAPLVCDALRMAIVTRGGVVAGVIMHTDRGSQYTSYAFTSLCERNAIVQSMSRAGSCLDNAPAEAWFSSFKTEFVYPVALPINADARRRIIAWIDGYNRTRRHSHCGLQAPITFETINPRRAA